MFLPNIMPPKHAEQDQIDAKWLGKKLVFWVESRSLGRSLIIINKSIKETENLIFFQCKIEFYFTHEHQNLFFHSWLPWILFHSWTPKLVFSLVATATRENTAFGVHSVK